MFLQGDRAPYSLRRIRVDDTPNPVGRPDESSVRGAAENQKGIAALRVDRGCSVTEASAPAAAKSADLGSDVAPLPMDPSPSLPVTSPKAARKSVGSPATNMRPAISVRDRSRALPNTLSR